MNIIIYLLQSKKYTGMLSQGIKSVLNKQLFYFIFMQNYHYLTKTPEDFFKTDDNLTPQTTKIIKSTWRFSSWQKLSSSLQPDFGFNIASILFKLFVSALYFKKEN